MLFDFLFAEGLDKQHRAGEVVSSSAFRVRGMDERNRLGRLAGVCQLARAALQPFGQSGRAIEDAASIFQVAGSATDAPQLAERAFLERNASVSEIRAGIPRIQRFVRRIEVLQH
jgi:hypothetical protein